MMRFSILCVVLLLCIGSVKSQVITITFEASLNGAPTLLDSILVINLTQGGDTTIYFPDNVLVLGTTGISDASTPGPLMQALPNPFAGSTEVVMHSTGGEALITLHDLAGRELVSHAANLPAGIQRIRVSCEGPGVYLLTVVQGGVRSGLRLIAAEGAGVAGISPVGGAVQGAPKSDRSLFSWAPGDALRYIGYATDGDILHSAAIDEVPDATATRTFVLFAGLTCPESPTVTDIDGNVYPAVQIGGQCWMAANLKTTRYRDGTAIPNVTDDGAWALLNSGAWSNSENSLANDTLFGKMYNWYAAADPNVCPQGWHVPVDADWQQLEVALGMPMSELGLTGGRGMVQNVGGKMKTTTLWVASNTGATNESGFSGLPGGYRSEDGSFEAADIFSYWWTASESSAAAAWYRGLSYNYEGIFRNNTAKRKGLYVRCVRD